LVNEKTLQCIMGVSMCSNASRITRTSTSSFPGFKFTEDWNTSELTDEEDVSRPNSPSMTSTTTVFDSPGNRSPVKRAKTQPISRSRGYSLHERMKHRSRSPKVDQAGELQAEKYVRFVKNDTLKHLHHTVRVAGSIVQKGNDINEELDRQGRVLLKAENDISIAEYETDQASQTLKGMSSLTSKVRSSIRRKEPKLKASELSMDLLSGEIGLCALSRMSTCKTFSAITKSEEHTQEEQIKSGMGQLHQALDVIKMQQMDTARTLENQEGRLTSFEDKLVTTNNKIKCQSQIMKKIIGKA